jgi:hypothetical protein
MFIVERERHSCLLCRLVLGEPEESAQNKHIQRKSSIPQTVSYLSAACLGQQLPSCTPGGFQRCVLAAFLLEITLTFWDSPWAYLGSTAVITITAPRLLQIFLHRLRPLKAFQSFQ